METDYWKSKEVQPDIDTWLDFWEGCGHCACDHGCNQWIKEQTYRAALVMRAMRLGSKKSVLDKLVQMPLDKADHIWHWIVSRESKVLNAVLRLKDRRDSTPEERNQGWEDMKAKYLELKKKRIQ